MRSSVGKREVMENNVTYLNLTLVIEQHARLTPEKEAVVYADTVMTYGQLNAYACRIANLLTDK